MLGPKQEAQAALFYEFSLEDHVPQDHLLRSVDRFVDLSSIRGHLADFYSHTGRPSVDPELLIRMLLVGYCFAIRSERRLCEEVHLNLAYRWFCRLDLSDRVPDHPTFSKNRDGRFRESALLRHLLETTFARCIAKTRQYEVSMKLRKKVEMLFAHLKRILGLGRLRLRGPCGANDDFLLAATAQNLRKLAKIFPAPQQTRKARSERHSRPVQITNFCDRNTLFFHRIGS